MEGSAAVPGGPVNLRLLLAALTPIAPAAAAQETPDPGTPSRWHVEAMPSAGVYVGNASFADVLLGLHASYPVHGGWSGFAAATRYVDSEGWEWSADVGVEARGRVPFVDRVAFVRFGIRQTFSDSPASPGATLGLMEMGLELVRSRFTPFVSVRTTWLGVREPEGLLGFRYTLRAR